MSGPFVLSLANGAINGAEINAVGIAINGFSGTAVIYHEMWLDELMFDLLIAGKLNVKEKVCADRKTPFSKALTASKYPAVCSKVKP